jgi:nucleoside-diphosphate-sugar epimerase
MYGYTTEDVLRAYHGRTTPVTSDCVFFSRLIAPHPNTYTYTKRLAECLIQSQYPDLPVIIARPAIGTMLYSKLFGCSWDTQEPLQREILFSFLL